MKGSFNKILGTILLIAAVVTLGILLLLFGVHYFKIFSSKITESQQNFVILRPYVCKIKSVVGLPVWIPGAGSEGAPPHGSPHIPPASPPISPHNLYQINLKLINESN